MPGFIDIVSFPTSDGALHQVYANVHEETDAKLSFEFDPPFLRGLLLSLRSRPEEKKRRIGRRPFDMTLGVYNHPAVDGDSMGLAFAITEQLASFFASKPQRPDGSLALGSLPRIIATGDIAENGAVSAVEGMNAKILGVLEAIQTGAAPSDGIFVFPAASKTQAIAGLIRDLDANGWISLPVDHIDELVPIWESASRRPRAATGFWARWKLPLKLGATAVALTLLAVFWVTTRGQDPVIVHTGQTIIDPAPQGPTSQPAKEVACVGLSGSELAGCVVNLQTREGGN